jgi:S-ribosylhomocysteine lyase LuxS involved in autoinducer biosynthesis
VTQFNLGASTLSLPEISETGIHSIEHILSSNAFRMASRTTYIIDATESEHHVDLSLLGNAGKHTKSRLLEKELLVISAASYQREILTMNRHSCLGVLSRC